MSPACRACRPGRWKDWNVTRYAIANDLVLVTNNASDFRLLFPRPLHADLVILLPIDGAFCSSACSGPRSMNWP
jgi:hypothetical protein